MKALAVATLIGLSGCSWIGVRSAPTAPWLDDGPPKCNGYALPIADGTVAAAGLGFASLLLVGLFGSGHGDGSPRSSTGHQRC